MITSHFGYQAAASTRVQSAAGGPAEGKYLVQRRHEAPDDGYNGGQATMRYVKTDEPIPGETLFHGPFRKLTDYGDGKYSEPTFYYEPVDPKLVTTSIYNGPGRGDVEVF
ncbi:MAG: hypothetical protein AMXMBFR33_43810 [Candidatus Xenobia bacterium]